MNRPRNRWNRGLRRPAFGVLALLAVAAVAVVTASAADHRDPPRRAGGPAPSASPAAPVIVPGRPGEPAKVVPGDSVKAPDGSAYGPLDAEFVRMMIPHHAQAVEMAALAPGRAANPQILAIAGRIAAAQAPEIASLRAWLTARRLVEDDAAADHQHLAMRGMQSPAAMQSLAAASGADFDQRFAAMMSAHHQGAIDMARDILLVVLDVRVEEIATAIATEQSIEITRIRAALAG